VSGFATYCLILAIGIVSARTQLVCSRGAYGFEVDGTSITRAILGTLSGLAFTSALIWGLIYTDWYLAILLPIGSALTFGLLITRSSLSAFIKLKPLIDAVIIGLTVYLWFLI
jgi:hypothetical protein